MKVIDLLNKIANGEEIPKKIKYKGRDMYFCKPCQIYELAEVEAGKLCGTDLYKILDNLNDEVEIIEEDKKIEPIPNRYDKQAIINYKQANFNSNDMKEICKSIGFLMENLNIVRDKLNEIIDKLNKED